MSLKSHAAFKCLSRTLFKQDFIPLRREHLDNMLEGNTETFRRLDEYADLLHVVHQSSPE